MMSISTSGPSPTPPPELYDWDDGAEQCLLCDRPEYRLERATDRFGFPLRFYRCRCDLIKQMPMPNPSFFAWFFNSDLFLSSKDQESEQIWGYYDYLADEPCRLATSRYRYWRLRRVLRSGRPLRVMKIGASTGSMLYLMEQHGHRALGCDVSARFVEFARSRYDVTIEQGRFEARDDPDSSYDVILLLNVIENVPDLDELLKAIARRLAPGGRLVLNYVEIDRNFLAKVQKEHYFLFRPPVCYIFGRAPLYKLLAKHGLRPEKVYRDIRVVHLEKVLTLLGWYRTLALARMLRLHRLRFPVYAYPSRLVVAGKAR